jgi:uncharacterized protein YoxC
MFGEPQWAKDLDAKLDTILLNVQAVQRREASEQHQLSVLNAKEDLIMAAVQIEQADLDAVAAAVEAVATAVSGLTEPLPAADESALNQAVSDLQTALANAQGGTTPTG